VHSYLGDDITDEERRQDHALRLRGPLKVAIFQLVIGAVAVIRVGTLVQCRLVLVVVDGRVIYHGNNRDRHVLNLKSEMIISAARAGQIAACITVRMM
jgi:hypothetical protein